MTEQVHATKKSRGRPRTGIGKPVHVRMHDDELSVLDKWIAKQPDPKPSRAEAIRRLVQIGIENSDESKICHNNFWVESLSPNYNVKWDLLRTYITKISDDEFRSGCLYSNYNSNILKWSNLPRFSIKPSKIEKYINKSVQEAVQGSLQEIIKVFIFQLKESDMSKK